ncbi:hypothetical protein N5C72_08705 [Achromobacter mucicolens]|uniref:Uncharacterized protein n=1 Tax=Achromobacter mucicolens TaxID=1389922 RepID=A0ABD4YRT5_9BURK|nr:hypothetical protein [Achromobacter mucicolens]MDH1178152.1 hypothetical protein [Achromobacter mucicolens]WGJ92487.1 hypothetical protein QEP15_09505 [Achromobacter mucicolens]
MLHLNEAPSARPDDCATNAARTYLERLAMAQNRRPAGSSESTEVATMH